MKIDRRKLLLGTAAIAGAGVAGVEVANAAKVDIADAYVGALVTPFPEGWEIGEAYRLSKQVQFGGGHIFVSEIDPVTGKKGEPVDLGEGVLRLMTRGVDNAQGSPEPSSSREVLNFVMANGWGLRAAE